MADNASYKMAVAPTYKIAGAASYKMAGAASYKMASYRASVAVPLLIFLLTATITAAAHVAVVDENSVGSASAVLQRALRSALAPPTVTSQHPRRQIILDEMIDLGPGVSIPSQSEGPKHPIFMRKAPPRLTSTLVEEVSENINRPHTMYHKTNNNDIIEQLEDGIPLSRYQPTSTYELQGHQAEVIYIPGVQTYETHELYDQYNHIQRPDSQLQTRLRHQTNSEYFKHDTRSRQRRVENSSGKLEQSITSERENDQRITSESQGVVRHGRYGHLLGASGSARQHTSGHARTFSDVRTPGTDRDLFMHPAARGTFKGTHTSQPNRKNGILSIRRSGQINHQNRFPNRFSNTQVTSETVKVSSPHEGSRGRVLFHPGVRMFNRGSNGGWRTQEHVVVHGSGGRRLNHPRMFSPKDHNANHNNANITPTLESVMRETNQTYEELTENLSSKGLDVSYLQNLINSGTSFQDIIEIISAPDPQRANLSLADIMRETNQTYEELMKNLENKGLNLAFLLRLTNSGTSLENIVKMISISDTQKFSTTSASITTSVLPTVNPMVWEQWLDFEIGRENEENNNISNINRQNGNINSDETYYYSDPVYANGVHPLNGNVEMVQATSKFITTDISSRLSDESYEDYYAMEDLNDYSDETARIHSLTAHELPWEDNYKNSRSHHYVQPEFFDYMPTDPHPHYNQWEQFNDPPAPPQVDYPSDSVSSSTNFLVVTGEVTTPPLTYTNLIAASATMESLATTPPLTYTTIIAASAIMGSLAIFTLFVLIAYTIVKCTKKPTLNNYQVSAKKSIEIAS